MENNRRNPLSRIFDYAIRLLKATHHIKYFWFWRVIYYIIESNVFLSITAFILRFIQKYYGSDVIDTIFNQIYKNFVVSGWPLWNDKITGWVNINSSRFLVNLRRRLNLYEQVKSRSASLHRNQPLRIGFFSIFNGLQLVSKELFEAFPSNKANLFIFDKANRGNPATYLKLLATEYTVINTDEIFTFSSYPIFQPAADAINNAKLDILINISGNYDLIDMIDTPCLIDVAIGSDLLHHEKVSFQINGQIPADYLIRKNRIFNCLSRTYMNTPFIYDDVLFYGRFRSSIGTQVLWENRLPLIFSHGSLYKLNSSHYLKQVFKLLQMDRDLNFVFMGNNLGTQLSNILDSAKKEGVYNRVHYEGAYNLVKNDADEFLDPGWKKMISYLITARLSPNPWPMGGGITRFECYSYGLPSVHLAVDNSCSSWGKPRDSVAEIPRLLAPMGTARNVDEYFGICMKCLYEKGFSDSLAKEQWEIAQRLSDPNYFWQKIFEYYHAWLISRNNIYSLKGRRND